MIRHAFLSIVLASLLAACGFAQVPSSSSAASVWNALSSPAMDPAKSARTETSRSSAIAFTSTITRIF